MRKELNIHAANSGMTFHVNNVGELIANSLWSRLVSRVSKDHELDFSTSEEIINATLDFLKMCADYPGNRFSPSKPIDIGWHTFLMYTRDYASFCDRYAGRMIHHVPNDDPDNQNLRGGVQRTVEFMRENGVKFNENMWPVDENGSCTVDCTDNCHTCSHDT